MRKNDNKDNHQPAMREVSDDEFGKLLKQEAYEAEPNQWFTHRVLHKLPVKKNNSALHMAWFFYLAAVVLCVGFWVWMAYFTDTSVITVRDILYFTVAGIVTAIVAFSPLVALFRHE